MRRWAARSGSVAVAGVVAAGLAACALPWRGAPAGPSPHEACRVVTEGLAAAVPPGESLAELQARGIHLRTPLRFAPGATPRPAQPSGAAVRLLIAPDGSVAPGSPRTVKWLGEAQVAAAMEAAALSMTFEFEPGVHPAAPVPFTTTLAICPRS